MKMHLKNKKGFTLIELLVVVSIISLLSSIVLVSLNGARSKARDAQRKTALRQMSTASELYFDTVGSYAATAGWVVNWNPVSNPLAPQYISVLSPDPGGNGVIGYQYWRKDYNGYACMTLNNVSKYAFYARLENPSATDLATISDSFDLCVQANWGMNYKVGS